VEKPKFRGSAHFYGKMTYSADGFSIVQASENCGPYR